MTSWPIFCEHVLAVTEVPLLPAIATGGRVVDPGQADIVSAGLGESLFVIAGPGSGKTTSSTLRLLKLLLVDDVAPNQLVATTFTRRAAAVLRSRIVEWGEGLRDRLLADPRPGIDKIRIERIDFNQIRIGTIDSIAQDLLNEYRSAGSPRPAPVEEHVYTALMMAEGVRPTAAANSRRLCTFLDALGINTFGGRLGLGGRADALVQVRQRLINDRVDRTALRAAAVEDNGDEAVGLLRALDAIDLFDSAMRDREIFDFAGLSEYFLESLQQGHMNAFLSDIKFVLVDEYQDTNFLQESIYFAMARAVRATGGSICVVGDDDQSLYRFRGATVELFAGFRDRVREQCEINARSVPLNRNYRSTPGIVTVVDQYARADARFQEARVEGKPALQHGGVNAGAIPLVGLFRQGEQALAAEVAQFIDSLVHHGGIVVNDPSGAAHDVQLDPQFGSAGDIAVLFDSAAEFSEAGRERFPSLLRKELASLANPILVFNPRGQPLRQQPAVRLLLGLALLSLDGDGSIQATQNIGSINDELSEWRAEASQFLTTASQELRQFVAAWAARNPTRALRRATNVSLADLLYKLVTWLPAFQHDIEHLAWLEAIMRAVSAASMLRGFHSELVFVPRRPDDELGRRSVADALWRVFAPIADNVIDVEEDLLETLPRNRVSFLTIHQAKGLEFPVTIVDVGSELGDGRVSRAFKRYPDEPDRTHLMENRFRPFSAIGLAERDSVDRAFDDLTRKYFVAFSRAQDLLVMVGDSVAVTGRSRAKKSRDMPSTATGWLRPQPGVSDLWPWRSLSFLQHL